MSNDSKESNFNELGDNKTCAMCVCLTVLIFSSRFKANFPSFYMC